MTANDPLPASVDPRYSALYQAFGDTLRLNEPLSRYSVARLGGPADVLLVATRRDILSSVVAACWEQDLPVRIVGGGANVLFSDKGYRGVLIVNHTKALSIDQASGIVIAESGVGIPTLARDTTAAGLSGFEWAINVPGTLGGAIVNNAGAHGSEMADSVQSVFLLFAPNRTETWDRSQMHYRYRESALKRSPERFVVLSAALQFSPGHDPAALHARTEAFTAHRRQTQPPGASLGSMFKNPEEDYAGRLIEAAGLKGKQIGGVQISPVHANFFINVGHGTASDYLALIRYAQEQVYAKFGVRLQLEIELIGEGFETVYA